MVILKICIFILNIIYGIIKIFPTNKKKVLFLSRQSKKMSIDYKLLISKLNSDYPEYKVVTIINLNKTKLDKIKYMFLTIKIMYELSTSKVCVIDGYNPLVSILNHKKSLRIIQLWHSLGAIKKFGYQTLDKKGGHSSKLSRVMKMHNNYDVIITGSKKMTPYFMKAFNQDEGKFKNYGLPRIDYLLKNSSKNKEKILNKYPNLKNKKVILYLPTLRKNDDYNTSEFDIIDKNKFELIIKGHPLKKAADNYNEFSSLELLSIADYVITDYSAISIEAAALNIPIYFYLYDIEKYEKEVGLNIDLFKEMPHETFKDLKELYKSLKNNKYSVKELESFKKNYIDNIEGDSTDKIISLVVGD